MEAVDEGRCTLSTQQAPPGGGQGHRFRLHYWVHDGVHPQGARLAVLGSGQALGDWRPEGAVLGKEIPARSGWWEVDTALPPGDRVEFKFAVVLRESETSVLRWEWRGNRELVVLPDTVQASVHALWDYGQYVDVQIARECPREVVSERGVGDHASLEEKPAGGSTSTSDPASSTLRSDTPSSPQSKEADSSGSNLARLQTQPRTSGAISWPKTEMEFRAHFPTPTQSALALIGNLPELGCWGRQGVVPAVPESEDWWSVRVAVPVDTPYQYSWLVLDPATGVATHTESVLRNRWTPPPGKSTVEEIVRLEFLPQSFKDLSLPLSHPEARYDQTQGGISLLPIAGFVSQLVGQSFSLERSPETQAASEPAPAESPQGIPLDILQHTSVETIHDSGIYHDEEDSLEAHIEPVQASAFSAKPKEGYSHVIKSENVDLLGAEAPGHEIKSENVDLLGAEAPGHVIKRENVDLLGAEAPGHVIKSKGVDLLGGEGSQDATTNTDVVATQSVRLGTTPLKTSTSGTMTPIRKTSESATMPDITEQREKATNTTMSGQKEACPAQKEAHEKSFTSTGSDPIFPYPCVESNNAEIKQGSSNPVVTLLLGLVALSATAAAVYFALGDNCEEHQGRERSVTGRTDL